MFFISKPAIISSDRSQPAMAQADEGLHVTSSCLVAPPPKKPSTITARKSNKNNNMFLFM
jgi:hypothetical protein